MATRLHSGCPDPSAPTPAEVARELASMGWLDASAESVAALAAQLGCALAPLPPDA